MKTNIIIIKRDNDCNGNGRDNSGDGGESKFKNHRLCNTFGVIYKESWGRGGIRLLFFIKKRGKKEEKRKKNRERERGGGRERGREAERERARAQKLHEHCTIYYLFSSSVFYQPTYVVISLVCMIIIIVSNEPNHVLQPASTIQQNVDLSSRGFAGCCFSIPFFLLLFFLFLSACSPSSLSPNPPPSSPLRAIGS